VTVTTAGPAPTTVTVAVPPLPETVATDVSLLAQVNVPPEGVPVAVNVPVLPAPQMVSDLGLSVTLQEHPLLVLAGRVEPLGPLRLLGLLQQDGQHMAHPSRL